MATVSPAQVSDGTTMDASDVNNPINTIANEFNGNIDNSNIKSAAAIDASKIAGGITGMFGAWTSWTPTWTNLTVGNGVNASRYIQIGKTVFFDIAFTFGSTSSMSSAPSFTLPVTTISYGANTSLGQVGLTDSSSGNLFPGPLLWLSTTTCQLQCLNVSGASVINASVTSTTPFGAAWATSDSIRGIGAVEVA